MKPLARNTETILALLQRATPDTSTREALKARILEREKVGYEKYKKTMDRRDYERRDWLIHLLEELLDASQYAMRAGDTELAQHLIDDSVRIQKEIDSIP
jgi:phosphopentomutase